jgi:hypothetical protein
MTAKTTAAVALTGAGFDPAEVCEMLGLPELTFTAPQKAPNPFGRAPQIQAKVKDPVAVAQEKIERNWADRLHSERKSLEGFIGDEE